MKIDTLYITR